MNTAPVTCRDSLLRFLLPDAGVRGVHAALDASWTELLTHADYPPALRELLGEACAASALLTGHVKVDGRLSIQLRGDGQPLGTLFAECTADGQIRGIARHLEGQDIPRDLRRLGEHALLAVTIENPGLDPRDPQRYQSLVELASPSLAEAFQAYFQQSEQLPTRLLLAADAHQARGLLLQKLPGDQGDADGWNRACALFDTLSEGELLAVPGTSLVHRLFHQEAPQLLGSHPLRFGCSCSQERVADVLRALGPDEARAAAEASGAVEVRCEFCGRQYRFPSASLPALFAAAPRNATAAPERLQ